MRPFSSALHLVDDLTLERIVQGGRSSWLVNLSACQTGIPDLTRPEQMISFPIGFLLGGAAHVLGTLWAVDDDRAMTFNQLFYEQFLAGAKPADAHREAVVRIREHTASKPAEHLPDHPMWWAQFVHYGSPN
jgi:CHAT domain-containing protein